MITKTKIEYKCPACGGIMKQIAGDDVFSSFQCEVCQAYFRVEVREELRPLKIGRIEVIIDNPKVYNILNS